MTAIYKATTKQVREHFANLGAQCRISRDGRVEFRYPDNRAQPGWREGRYMAEYFYDVETGHVFHN